MYEDELGLGRRIAEAFKASKCVMHGGAVSVGLEVRNECRCNVPRNRKAAYGLTSASKNAVSRKLVTSMTG